MVQKYNRKACQNGSKLVEPTTLTKPNSGSKCLQSLQGQFFGFHLLISDLKDSKQDEFLISIGIEFHINGPRYLIEL